MQVVILCGGEGTRLKEKTEYIPKPMVPIGGVPILKHIMDIYARQGFTDFILCLGYKGDGIKQYFRKEMNSNLGWTITMADTGLNTLTGGRLKMVDQHITGDEFMVTYGDGLADIDFHALKLAHRRRCPVATITAIQPVSRFGILELDGANVKSFREKPRSDDWINGGFFFFNRSIFDHLDDQMLVQSTLPHLASIGQLDIHRHTGFWHCMDTYRDYLSLNKIWEAGAAPWTI